MQKPNVSWLQGATAKDTCPSADFSLRPFLVTMSITAVSGCREPWRTHEPQGGFGNPPDAELASDVRPCRLASSQLSPTVPGLHFLSSQLELWRPLCPSRGLRAALACVICVWGLHFHEGGTKCLFLVQWPSVWI